MAGELTSVVTGGTIEASFINNVKDRTVMRYASTAERTSLIPTPVEGDVAYLEDSNVITYYDGSAWQEVHTLDAFETYTTVASTSATDSGYPSLGGFSWSAWKNGAVVSIRVYCVGVEGEDSTGRSIDLPAAYRPGGNMYVAGTAFNSSSLTNGVGAAGLLIRSDGTMYLTWDETATSSNYKRFVATFVNGGL